MFNIFSNIKILSIIGCIVGVIGIYVYISSLRHDNAKLTVELNNATIQILTLENQKKQLEKDLQKTQEYYNKVSSLENQLMTEYRSKILKIEEIDKENKLKSLLSSRKSSLLLRKINNQAKCQWDNFFNYDINCIDGQVK